MAQYACYMFDRFGAFVAEHEIEERTDEAAVATARNLFRRSRFEVFRDQMQVYPAIPILKVASA